MNSSTPLWQQVVVIIFALATAFLLVWFGIHTLALPDWIAAIAGVFVGFISHALASTTSTNASQKALETFVAATPSVGTPAPTETISRPAQTPPGAFQEHVNVGG